MSSFFLFQVILDALSLRRPSAGGFLQNFGADQHRAAAGALDERLRMAQGIHPVLDLVLNDWFLEGNVQDRAAGKVNARLQAGVQGGPTAE
jgi:hypothetical protein